MALFAGFIILSCNGRDKAMVSPKESLIERKLLDSFSESTKYFPEDYAEVETDTTLSNGFRVYTKTFTDMKSSVINEFKQDTISHLNYYRDNKVSLQVSKNDELVFEYLFDKTYFIRNYPKYKDYFEESNLVGMWLNQDYVSNNNVLLRIAFCKPETNLYLDYDLLIDTEGHYSLKEIKQEEIL